MVLRNSIYPLPRVGGFPHISMSTMTTFPGTSLIIKKINWVESERKFSIDAMSSPNIPGLAIVLSKTFPSLIPE